MRELQPSATGASPMTWSPFIRHRRGFIVATVAALLMTLTGAFGTDHFPLAIRLGYWLVVMESGALIGVGVTAFVEAWGRYEGRPWTQGVLISLMIALPLTLVVLGTGQLFFGSAPSGPRGLAIMFAFVLAIVAAITAVNVALARQSPAVQLQPEPTAAPAPSPAEPQRPKLADRLPRRLRDSPIRAIEAEDHYLRVHTEAGSELILLRLGDAIAELAGVDGLRTHRSWWVAREAVIAADRRDGRAELTLAGGIVAPVSRSELPRLRDAGWFDGL